MKLTTIIGARPQFIKAASVSRAINQHNLSTNSDSLRIKEIIIHTGQHYDKNMSAVFFEEMEIPKPDYTFNINRLSHGAMTGKMIEKTEQILLQEKPDYVLVYGDTNTTLAGALAASKLNIPVAHVEAGLRSFNKNMPEEINRIVTDHVSLLLFCPTKTAVYNLQNEGFSKIIDSYNDISYDLKSPVVINIGDVMYDTALFYSQKASKINFPLIESIKNKDFILCTIHRAENTDDPKKLSSIFQGIGKIAKQTNVVLPLHPRTQNKLSQLNIQIDPNIDTIEPVSYFEMIELLKRCKMVITDSGGLQKEAFFFKKMCVTVRDETEWTELVDNGFNTLAPTQPDLIYNAYKMMYNKIGNFDLMLYGNGNAANKIIQCLLQAHNK